MPVYEEVDPVYEYLDMSNKKLGVDEVSDIFMALSEDHILKQLDLSFDISLEEASIPAEIEKVLQAMKDAFEVNQTLTALDFRGNHIGNFGPHPLNRHHYEYLKEITKALAKSKIKKLDLSQNMILGEGSRIYSGLSTLIKKFVIPNEVHTLKLQLNDLHSQAMCLFAHTLGPKCALVELDLSDNCCGLDPFGNVNPEGTSSLSKMFAQSHSLKRLYLARNHLHDADLIALCDAFNKMPSLNLLDFTGNHFTHIGMEALKETITSHSNLRGGEGLKTILLGSNPIGTSGLEHISNAIKLNDTVTTLDISNCGFRSLALDYMQKCLIRNGILLNLNTQNNRITQDAQDSVQAEVEANNCILSLRNNYKAVDADKLAPKSYHALARKLKLLPMGILSLLHNVPSFNMPLSPMCEALYLLCNPDRSRMVRQVAEQSASIRERLLLSGLLGNKLSASRIIYYAVMKWFRRVQKRNALRKAAMLSSNVGKKKLNHSSSRALKSQPSTRALAIKNAKM